MSLISLSSLSKLAIVAAVLSAGPIQAATMNGFANGGFETVGTTTPAEAWNGAAAGYTRSSDARTGNFSAQLMSPQLSAAVVLQNSVDQGGMPPLTEGDTPTLSFWAKGFAGTTGNVLFALRYLDNVGNILADSQNQRFETLINESTWTEITYTSGPVPAGATAAFIEFSQGLGPINPDLQQFGGTVLIDDVYLGVVAPESTANPRDFDADGLSDILWQNTATGQRYVWFMNGLTRKGGAFNVATVPTDWSMVGTGDFDADGQPDILWENTVTGQRNIWYMNGAVRKGGAVNFARLSTDWHLAGTDDFDADGQPDILWENNVTGQRYVWLMNGVTRKGGAIALGTVPPEWKIAGTGDFDGDGKPDILWQNGNTGQRSVWPMDGVVRKGATVSLGTFNTAWQIAGVGDYDGDGQPDILWQNTTDGTRLAWLMNGLTRKGGAIPFANIDTDWSIVR
jgi:hypothetical protein